MPYLKKNPLFYRLNTSKNIRTQYKTVGSYLNDLSDVLPFGTAVNFGGNVLKSHFDEFLDP